MRTLPSRDCHARLLVCRRRARSIQLCHSISKGRTACGPLVQGAAEIADLSARYPPNRPCVPAVGHRRAGSASGLFCFWARRMTRGVQAEANSIQRGILSRAALKEHLARQDITTKSGPGWTFAAVSLWPRVESGAEELPRMIASRAARADSSGASRSLQNASAGLGVDDDVLAAGKADATFVGLKRRCRPRSL